LKSYRFLPEADAEFREQIAWYDRESTNLGDKFIADVEGTVSDIRQYPASGSRVSKRALKRVLRVFKYNVFYVNAPDEVIIVAVAPHRKHPNYWRKRLRAL
jgi:toxin ParE1/3/4